MTFISQPLLPMQSSLGTALSGTANVPGDKSISHRALILASQVEGITTIEGMLEGEDVLNTAKALQNMGISIERPTPGNWRVEGKGIGRLAEPSDILDMGNSGTGTRLMMGLVAPYPFVTFFTGDASLRKRPMQRVITPLSQMGATFVTREGGRLPVALSGSSQTKPISYILPVASAQVKSAILLAALNIEGETSVIEPEATRDHTERMLKHFGWKITTSQREKGGCAITLQGKQHIKSPAQTITIPADPSSCAFLVVAALLVPGSDLLIPDVCVNPLRIGLFNVLRSMGAKIDFLNLRVSAGEDIADISVKYSRLKAIDIPAHLAPSMIDEYPILAVAASFAEGTTVMHGLAELKVKESDRLSAIAQGLEKCGVQARIDGDILHVTGHHTVAGGATVNTYYDHRIAMSFLVMGMASKHPVSIDDGSAINTSFPHFADTLNALGARIRPLPATASLVIAIDGPAASGKGTLARRLAEHLDINYLDTGSLYRAVGLRLIYSGKDPYDTRAAILAAHSITAHDLANPRLRQERIGKAASIVSAIPEVRDILLDFQRNYATQAKGAVLDGRDIGTVVCPEAPIKIFITASLQTRAQRRHRELQGEGIQVVYESVLAELRERDNRDAKRKVAPLLPAPDAIIIDTSELDAASVFAKVLKIVEDYQIRHHP